MLRFAVQSVAQQLQTVAFLPECIIFPTVLLCLQLHSNVQDRTK